MFQLCNQHPQSVASFHYEPMCFIGRALAEAMGIFKNYGAPDIVTETYVIQDKAGIRY